MNIRTETGIYTQNDNFNLEPVLNEIATQDKISQATTEKIEKMMRNSYETYQKPILEKLLRAGEEGKTVEGRAKLTLAAQLFMKISKEEDREDFIFTFRKVESLFKGFTDAIVSNQIGTECKSKKLEKEWGLDFDLEEALGVKFEEPLEITTFDEDEPAKYIIELTAGELTLQKEYTQHIYDGWKNFPKKHR